MVGQACKSVKCQLNNAFIQYLSIFFHPRCMISLLLISSSLFQSVPIYMYSSISWTSLLWTCFLIVTTVDNLHNVCYWYTYAVSTTGHGTGYQQRSPIVRQLSPYNRKCLKKTFMAESPCIILLKAADPCIILLKAADLKRLKMAFEITLKC